MALRTPRENNDKKFGKRRAPFTQGVERMPANQSENKHWVWHAVKTKGTRTVYQNDARASIRAFHGRIKAQKSKPERHIHRHQKIQQRIGYNPYIQEGMLQFWLLCATLDGTITTRDGECQCIDVRPSRTWNAIARSQQLVRLLLLNRWSEERSEGRQS
jgi:hypothetical protein